MVGLPAKAEPAAKPEPEEAPEEAPPPPKKHVRAVQASDDESPLK